LPKATVDFTAAGRVAKRAELKSVRVIEVSAKCDPQIAAPLEPTVNLECSVALQEANTLQIACNCHFAAHTTQAQVAQAEIKYLIIYEIQGTEPLAPGDVAEFATSNGTLNAWPFLREFLYGLTSKMGYPAYVLPTFHFVPKPLEKKESMEKSKPQAELTKSEPKA